jgi:serine/threonine protein kinase
LLSKKSTSDSDDYEKICTLGKGAYGLVSLARKNGKLYAIKAIEKKKLAK